MDLNTALMGPTLALTPRTSETSVANPLCVTKTDEMSNFDNFSERCLANTVVNDFTTDCLLANLNTVFEVKYFLKFMGIVWPDPSDNVFDKCLQYVWSA